MGQIVRTQLLPQTKDIKDSSTKSWAEKITTFLDNTVRKIASIPFNISDTTIIADTGTATVEFAVIHHLGKIPSGFIITNTNKSGTFYASGTAWTATEIYLKSSAANAAITVLMF